MPREPLFKGLVVDEDDQAVETGWIGTEPCYIVNDSGFKRHIPAEEIDLEILRRMGDQIKGNEEMIADQAAKMSGQDDLFSHAMIENSLKNMDKQFALILQQGLPEDTRAYLGMMGFRIVVNIHGEIVNFIQPSAAADGGDGGED